MLCFIGQALMENRSGLIVRGDLTQADSHAEPRAALDMIHRHSPGSIRQLTLGADKGFDAAKFIADLPRDCVTPHVAQKVRHSASGGRTTRHEGCALSIRHRKQIEEAFGWARAVGCMAQTVYRGVERVRSRFILTMTANTRARLPRLLAGTTRDGVRKRIPAASNDATLKAKSLQKGNRSDQLTSSAAC